MLRNNIAGQISQIGLGAIKPATVIENPQSDWAQDLSSAFSGWDKATKKKAYIDALQSGDQEKIDSALADYNPESYADVMTAREKRQQDLDDLQAKQDFQREMMDLQNQRAIQLENMRHNNAMGLAQFKASLANQMMGVDGQTEDSGYKQAQDSINQLYDVAKNDNIGVFTNWRREHGLTGKETEREYGRISSAVAGLAPRAISKLKAAGVSGINSLPEFMTYIGLPQNPTSQQIMGAIPMMAQIAGVENPIKDEPVQPKNPIPQQQPSLKSFNNGLQAGQKIGKFTVIGVE